MTILLVSAHKSVGSFLLTFLVLYMMIWNYMWYRAWTLHKFMLCMTLYKIWNHYAVDLASRYMVGHAYVRTYVAWILLQRTEFVFVYVCGTYPSWYFLKIHVGSFMARQCLASKGAQNMVENIWYDSDHVQLSKLDIQNMHK